MVRVDIWLQQVGDAIHEALSMSEEEKAGRWKVCEWWQWYQTMRPC